VTNRKASTTPARRWWTPITSLRRWLSPGIGIKRWLFLVFVGELCLALSGALALRQFYREVDASGPVQTLIYLVTLQFLPYFVRGAILAGLGAGLFVLGSIRIVRVLMGPFRSGDGDQPLVEVIYQKRFLARGPRIVAIGGGTGLSTLLRGLKEHTSNLTAVVTVADDGGSSGVLREQLGVAPVGDIRNCIVALADAEPLMGRLLQYRFPGPEGDPSTQPLLAGGDPRSLAGHAVGNLLIAAMTAVEDGDFEEGVRQMNRVLAVRGQVLPASATPLTLHAHLADGTQVDGQSLIARTKGIRDVWLSPDGVRAAEDAITAIEEAEVIVIGPGSLFSSVLPNLLISDIRDAVGAATGVRVYVCNVATQPGETGNYSAAAHLDALFNHVGDGLIDYALINGNQSARRPEGWLGQPVLVDERHLEELPVTVIEEDLVDLSNAHRHDSAKLAAALMRLQQEERAERVRQRRVRRPTASAV
jgi:uncharacterized cofD-like protein